MDNQTSQNGTWVQDWNSLFLAVVGRLWIIVSLGEWLFDSPYNHVRLLLSFYSS